MDARPGHKILSERKLPAGRRGTKRESRAVDASAAHFMEFWAPRERREDAGSLLISALRSDTECFCFNAVRTNLNAVTFPRTP